jgi:hypothetical protein
MTAPLFESMNGYLREDYRDESELGYSSSCTLVAIELAKKLAEEGRNPQIFTITGAVTDSVGNTKALVPKVYEGRITWGAHVVCVADGVVYDPMLSTPLPVEEYLTEAFNQPVVMRDRTEILHR